MRPTLGAMNGRVDSMERPIDEREMAMHSREVLSTMKPLCCDGGLGSLRGWWDRHGEIRRLDVVQKLINWLRETVTRIV